jgi:hypothetical protein
MEWWSNGVMRFRPNTPTLLYSSTPFFLNLDPLRSLVVDLPIDI